ncbi:hypothetical protein ACFPM1_12855 [Halorubrum rubrum]|uniref:Twin-arginine translocation signal domain-containing protein n=1 Tax=Halorubrum rubrum TaxID=1126240 RepID=A0ABD5R3Z3_9EURY|nr:hypothetical protein [Halorubrum rubrum]
MTSADPTPTGDPTTSADPTTFTDPTPTEGGGRRPPRRRFLAAAGAAASAALAGCGGVVPETAPDDDGPNEVTVENATDSAVEVAVRVVDGEGETLFGRVFALEPETIASRDGFEAVPEEVHAFTADGLSRTWRYDPDLPIEFECEPKDVGLTLREDAIEPWYGC